MKKKNFFICVFVVKNKKYVVYVYKSVPIDFCVFKFFSETPVSSRVI